MSKLWVRWLALALFVVILGAVCFNLGEWQLRRLDERQQRNAATIANEQRPVQPYREIFSHPIADDQQWQRVEAQGTFDAEHQFVVRFRSNGEETGYEVVTPLQTATGAVLVNRGFIKVDKGVQIPTTAPPPPVGTVTVVGHVRRNEQGRRGAIQPNAGQIRLINAPALAPALPYPIVDGYIGAITVDPAQDGDFKPVVPPELSDGPHFWYAVQWFMFAGIGILGLVVFIRGDLRERRKRA